MSRYVIGIDGCRGGWVAVDEYGGRFASSLRGLLEERPPDIAAIDIPIGLVERGRRDCDIAAREHLGIRRNSVFFTPTRAAIRGASSQDEATRINREHRADGVSAQAYNLFSKIIEVDDLLHTTPSWREAIHEVHPELSFAAWRCRGRAGLDPMPHAKKSGLGAYDRLSLIFDRHETTAFEQLRATCPRKDLADDDIADAYAALYSAQRIARSAQSTLPDDNPPTDARNLPMRIVY